jgi:hypothetical protein
LDGCRTVDRASERAGSTGWTSAMTGIGLVVLMAVGLAATMLVLIAVVLVLAS